jgi:hypothetical protein
MERSSLRLLVHFRRLNKKFHQVMRLFEFFDSFEVSPVAYTSFLASIFWRKKFFPTKILQYLVFKSMDPYLHMDPYPDQHRKKNNTAINRNKKVNIFFCGDMPLFLRLFSFIQYPTLQNMVGSHHTIYDEA